MRIERRQSAPRWLLVGVPVLSLIAAFAAAAVVLLIAARTHSQPTSAYSIAPSSRLSAHNTLVTATPLLMTGLAAAAAFRMRLWNIGGEGQLYLGAIGASGVGIALQDQPGPILIAGMIAAACSRARRGRSSLGSSGPT